jgi:metallo-beta-lactamase family protein
MKLTFLGANRQVTGSRYCLEAGGSRILIDCGMFQERDFLSRNWEPCPVPAGDLDALLLTHAHVDHCGLIPRLVAEGFRGPIYATRPTVALAEVVLRDAARIQSEDVAYKKRRHAKEGRVGRYPEVPLYTEADAEAALPLFRPVPYRKPVPLDQAFSVRFHDAGHILGSAMLEVFATEGEATRSLIFSGDVGQWDKPLIRDPSLFERADYVVMETTYGDRDHMEAGDVETQLCDVVNETAARGGVVLIPTFAVERAQELMYHFSRLVYQHRIPKIPIFLDSPMAVDVTKIFLKSRDYFDQETWELTAAHMPPLEFPGLRLVSSVEESKSINAVRTPAIIMASSGMCTAGRIKHHLEFRIGRHENTLLFVGYQGQGTLGRQILDGQSEVRIHGRLQRVRAKIAQIHGLSGHADRTALLRWLDALQSPPRRVFLTHGEEQVALKLAQYLEREKHWQVLVPQYQETVEL